MPDLSNVLQGHDLGFFKIVAEGWGIELDAPDAYTAQSILEAAMRDRALLEETVEVLPVEAQHALGALLANEGRMPWAQFERLHGEIRTMGPARRDRERPDLDPISPAEQLWYRALIGRAFLNLPPEPQEYFYIPEDLINIFPSLGDSDLAPLGRPASPQESAQSIPASDEILDHACTLLAALRCKMDLDALDTIHEQNMRPYVEKVYPWNPELFRKGFRPEDYRVILDEGEVVGMTKVVPAENSIYLAEIQIRPSHQRRGIGTAIIQSVLRTAADSGLRVWLKVVRGNPAMDLYARLGFSVFEETETHTAVSILR